MRRANVHLNHDGPEEAIPILSLRRAELVELDTVVLGYVSSALLKA